MASRGRSKLIPSEYLFCNEMSLYLLGVQGQANIESDRIRLLLIIIIGG